MIRRLFPFALALIMAVTAGLAQVDQQARISPHLATLLPDSFSANAARERSKLALQLGEGESALAEARLGIALRPVPAESLTVLALAAIQAGEQELARDALGAASRRGWREPVSQLASGEAAFAQGEFTIAAQRGVALLSTGNLREPAYELLARLVAVPEGRHAVAERLASFGRWQTGAIGPVASVAAADDWATTLAEAQELGAQLDCGRLRQLARAYHRREEDEAAALVSALVVSGDCPAG